MSRSKKVSSLKKVYLEYSKVKAAEEKALNNLRIVYSDTFIYDNSRVISELCDFLHCEYIDYIVARSFTDSSGHYIDYLLVNTNIGKHTVILTEDDPMDLSYYGRYIFDTVIVKSATI